MDLIALEERAYRNWATKCTESEERNILLSSLVRKEVGLTEIGQFVRHEERKLKGGGE